MSSPALLAVPILVAAVVAFLGTLLVRAVARRTGFVSHPNPLVPQHTRPVAYLGGLGVMIGVVASVLVSGSLWSGPPAPGLATGALLFLALGLYDDLRPLRPMTKLLLQIVFGTVAAMRGLVAPVSGNPGFDMAFAVGMMVLFVNAVNVTDVCDGLVAGLGTVAFLWWGVIDPSLAPLAWCAAAACFGFLMLNRPPATIFLGDAGSHLIGFGLAALSLLSGQRSGDAARVVVGGLVAAVFLFETTFLIVVRTRKGIRPWRASRDHFALRLQARGWSRGMTDMAAWTVGSMCGLAALQFAGADATERAVLLAALGFTALLVAYGLRQGTTVSPEPVRKAVE